LRRIGQICTLDSSAIDVICVEKAIRRKISYVWFGLLAVNPGPYRGPGVPEHVRQFERASGSEIAWRVASHRAGDISCYFADAALAQRMLGWSTTPGIERMCSDSWRWQTMNPAGFDAP